MDIVSVIESTGTRLTKRGNNYVGLCPLHNDKDTPSLVVYPHTNSWHCFGNCQSNGGDAIEFIKQRYNYNYFQAKEYLDLHSFNVKRKAQEPIKTIPVPLDAVNYWHQNVDRNYFHGRGFTDETIDRERWGWDGQRHTIPVWEGKPGCSTCIGVRRRLPDEQQGQRYIGLANMNPPTVWGRWYCRDQETILAFAGELDAAMAVQDGLPSFSLVNGINAMMQFPTTWPYDWFPDSKYLIAVFDRGEESAAGTLCSQWNKVKGTMTGQVYNWVAGDFKDYCEYRKQFPAENFNVNFNIKKVVLSDF